MYIALCYGCHYCAGCIEKCGMVVMAMLAVYCSVLWLSVLCCMYVSVCHKCQNYLCCILQCSTVVMNVLEV